MNEWVGRGLNPFPSEIPASATCVSMQCAFHSLITDRWRCKLRSAVPKSQRVLGVLAYRHFPSVVPSRCCIHHSLVLSSEFTTAHCWLVTQIASPAIFLLQCAGYLSLPGSRLAGTQVEATTPLENDLLRCLENYKRFYVNSRSD